ncbi:MAG: molybdopterin-synthase adenylyltransferase MoeB [Bacteroidetes bacterium]|jgi:sulfur-carrier protein adenylyltransferase/sulfurtransferase|nr:molybdopterin-synthase adenylyltransferase MoeB [Bacteroidota bacterium]MBT6685620.1 molybdopterin-synthase adenylyltransferase MoeB [Bacteroidota bacterium]MBT7144701.1 molybdopterin-synthase adenylyltransferase MoeB [Bacteroidota bacterium]MBT7491822.1 molybdopterin-synthase adenylyltransferase MoeB [Bacteroidota bacterium]
MVLNNIELQRYNRHIIMPEIGLKGQQKLKNAKVLVVGAGGLGCPVLQYLSAAGIGTIGIVDFDIVSESNLQRQILFDTNDIGKPKVKVAKEKLSAQNPFVKFEIHNTKLSRENVLEIFSNYEIIIDGSDNFPTRYLINDACVILSKPLVFGAIYKFIGQASVFNYKGGPTYRCLFPEQPETDDVPTCSTIGVLGVMPGMIGTIQANEAIKIALDIGKTLSGKLLQIDALNFSTNIITFKRNPEVANVTELGEYFDFCEPENETKINSISPDELYKLIQKKSEPYIIDIREKHQFEDYNIGGKCYEVSYLFDNLNEIPANRKVVIVCEFGEKSLAVVEYLQENENFLNVYNLEGGVQAWISEYFPFCEKKK